MIRISSFQLIASAVCVISLPGAHAQPTLRPLATGFGTPIGMALDEAGGKLYAAEFGGLISVTNTATGVRTVLGTGYTTPEDRSLC